MSEKNSIARKLRWSKISPEERSIMMSNLAKIKAKKMTTKQRKDHALMMVASRLKHL